MSIAAVLVLLLQTAPAAGAEPAPPAPSGRITIDAYDRRIEGWRSPDDEAYEATVLGGAAVAESRRGPLEGRWTVTAADGAPLFGFVIVDPGTGAVEGAWRDLAADGALRRSGFIALIWRDAAQTTFRFLEPGASAPTVLTLEPALDGSWLGQITREGVTAPVVMRRR